MTTPTTVQARFQLRADTAANWTSVNPVLLNNEFGLETDTKKLKVGNGSTAWNSLAYFPSIVSGGTVLGNLEIGTTGTLTFEGSTADGFETTLAVTNPTADRTITLPNQSGDVIVSGNASIVNADISASAEIAVSKLADGAARQLLQTDAAGTGVEWTDNVDIPGTLDVTGAATFDAAVTIAGDLTVNGTTTNINTQNLVVEDKNIIIGDVATPTDVTADGGGITLKGATDKTLNWVDATNAWTSSEYLDLPAGTAANPSLFLGGDVNSGLYSPGADQVAISTGGSGRITIDASGRLLVGTSSTSAANTLLLQASSAGSTIQAILTLARGQTSPADAALLGSLRYADSGHVSAAEINVRRDGGTWTSGTSQPTRLEFSTTADGASSPTERMRIGNAGTTTLTSAAATAPFIAKISTTEAARIDSSGRLLVGTSTYSFGSAGVALLPGGQLQATKASDKLIEINRLTTDGALIGFYQDTTEEGTISVSGTTVSYNGAHLSRWSQLPSGAERTEILRGSVLSNLDEMCEWGDEENEQLNRMKVSDVEGDKNVSGVFQCWDDDDDTYTNDFYCAMTGDFIIRIADGVTVERGDLLMSAGDGTAKPQDDDIIRSKTIAKVTSTNVSCTYDDGSYCVPCVLMAC